MIKAKHKFNSSVFMVLICMFITIFSIGFELGFSNGSNLIPREYIEFYEYALERCKPASPSFETMRNSVTNEISGLYILCDLTNE